MPLRTTLSLPLVLTLALYLLALVGLGSYLFWPKNQEPLLRVTHASLAPTGDRVLLEGEGFSEATQVSLSLDVYNRRFLRHSVPTYGRGADMVRVGGFAYVLVQKKGLVILDLVVPQRPRVVSTLELPGVVWTLTVNEGVAYIACGRAGLALVDVRDPHLPRQLATFPELQMVQALAVRGGRLYASVYARDVDPALVVVDVSELSHPRLLGRVPLPGQPLGVALSGQNVLVAAGKAGLIYLELGEGLPRVSSLLPLPGSAHSLVVAGDHAYIVCTLGGLAVVEMATGAPRLQAHLPLPVRPTRLVVEGGRLYLVGLNEGCQVIDISRPSQPRPLGSFKQAGGLASVAAVGATVYLNTCKQGLQVVDLSQPTPEKTLGPELLGEYTKSVSQEGSLLAITTKSGHLHLYQLQEGASPQHLSTIALPLKGPVDPVVTLQSGYAYIRISGSGLVVVDVRQPRVPVSVGHYPFEGGRKNRNNDLGNLSALALSESRGALVDNNGLIWFFDTNQPGALQLKEGPDIQDKAARVMWGGDFLYVVSVSYKTIRAIDMRQPYIPVVLPALSVPTISINDLAIKGKMVVLACGLEGLITVDFSIPAAPKLLVAYPLPINASRIHIEGSIAYLGDLFGGLLQVDLSDPVTPRLGGLLTDAGVLEDFIVSGKQALVVAGHGGLVFVPFPQTLQPVDRNKRAMSLELPPIDTTGHYTLRITDGSQSVVLPGVLALARR